MSYLITGSTGVVGSAVLVNILLNTKGDCYLLIRSRSDDELKARWKKIFQFIKESHPNIMIDEKRITLVRGDITKNQLGVDPKKWEELSSSVSHIIHCAANVKMNLPIEEARKISVHSVKELLVLARILKKKGVFKKFDCLSTVGVIGRETKILKEEAQTHFRGFRNTYEQAKAEAEEMLYAEFKKKELPITIHRPSMIVGDSKTGKVWSYQIFYLLCDIILGKWTNGISMRFKHEKLDIVPVDYLADVICWSSQSKHTENKILHLSAGPGHEIKLRQLQKIVGQINLKSQRYHSLPLFLIKFLIFVLGVFNLKKKQLPLLKVILSYIKTPQTFETHRTHQLISSFTSIQIPNPKNYLEIVLSKYYSKKEIK